MFSYGSVLDLIY